MLSRDVTSLKLRQQAGKAMGHQVLIYELAAMIGTCIPSLIPATLVIIAPQPGSAGHTLPAGYVRPL